jgi:glycosyltransferase involved in cell wall biosynthesis
MQEAATTSGTHAHEQAPGPTDDPGRSTVHLLLPCFNEEQSIQPMVETLARVFADQPAWDVTAVFIDDGSHDDTWQEIARVRALDLPISVGGIRLEHNQGKAAAQAIGIREVASAGGLVVLMDADGQHDPSQLPTILRTCEDTRIPQIARRTDYRRGRTSMAGTVGLGVMSGLTGVRFDPTLGEYLVLPSRTVRQLARNPQLGVVPIVPLVQGISSRMETFSSPVLDRADGSTSTRWTRSQLWHKALLLLLANPWALLPRMAIIVVLTVLGLGSYGMVVGIGSIVHGTFLGVGSVLVAIVMVFGVLAGLQLVTLGLVVVLFRTIAQTPVTTSSDVEVLDWRSDRH